MNKEKLTKFVKDLTDVLIVLEMTIEEDKLDRCNTIRMKNIIGAYSERIVALLQEVENA